VPVPVPMPDDTVTAAAWIIIGVACSSIYLPYGTCPVVYEVLVTGNQMPQSGVVVDK
jgi:hypothetical protein